MKRFLLVLAGTVASVFLVLYDVDLFTRHLSDVQGNLEASVIWGTPTAVLFVARAEWRHRQRMAHLDSLHAKVDAVHEHLGIKTD